MYNNLLGFPDGSDDIEPACNTEDLGLILGSGKSPGEGNGNPLLYSCLENPMDRRSWWVTVHGVRKSQTRLSDLQICTHTHTHTHIRTHMIAYTDCGMYMSNHWDL